MENLPTEENMEFGSVLPSRWKDIKEKVFIQYFSQRCDTDADPEKYTTLEDLIADYNRTAW